MTAGAPNIVGRVGVRNRAAAGGGEGPRAVGRRRPQRARPSRLEPDPRGVGGLGVIGPLVDQDLAVEPEPDAVVCRAAAASPSRRRSSGRCVDRPPRRGKDRPGRSRPNRCRREPSARPAPRVAPARSVRRQAPRRTAVRASSVTCRRAVSAPAVPRPSGARGATALARGQALVRGDAKAANVPLDAHGRAGLENLGLERAARRERDAAAGTLARAGRAGDVRRAGSPRQRYRRCGRRCGRRRRPGRDRCPRARRAGPRLGRGSAPPGAATAFAEAPSPRRAEELRARRHRAVGPAGAGRYTTP